MTDYDLGKKIDEYSDELYFDLGLTGLPEEEKADIYARVQEHMHAVILMALRQMIGPAETEKIHEDFEREDYRSLRRALKKFPKFVQELDNKIKDELGQLKLTIAEEQKHGAGEIGTPAAPAGGT